MTTTGERLDLSPTANPNEWTAGNARGLVYDPNDPNECAFFEVDDPNDPTRVDEIPFELYANDGTLLATAERVTTFWL